MRGGVWTNWRSFLRCFERGRTAQKCRGTVSVVALQDLKKIAKKKTSVARSIRGVEKIEWAVPEGRVYVLTSWEKNESGRFLIDNIAALSARTTNFSWPKAEHEFRAGLQKVSCSRGLQKPEGPGMAPLRKLHAEMNA